METNRAALLIEALTVRSAVQAVVEGLSLTVALLTLPEVTTDSRLQYEIVIADEAAANAIRPLLDSAQLTGETIKPSLVALGSGPADSRESNFDGFIAVPSMLAEMSARLSVILYSHRALARRYKSSLEELNLNRNIFRSVTNGISVANAQMPDMPLMYVNPSFELMTGYSLEEIQGKNCRFLQSDDRDQPGLTLIREALAQGRGTVAVIRNYRKDGSCFWNELTLSPVRNREGELTHFVGIQLDVTDRVRIESALRESEKLAAVGRLASTISHEINNPLEAVMNLVYLSQGAIREDNDPAQAMKYLKTADEELERIKLIAAQSLRFSRQSSRPEAVRINDIVLSAIDVYRARLRNYGVEVTTRLRSTQHVVVYQSEIRQVISNLVNNAIDALKEAPNRNITLRTRESTDWRNDRNGVLISVIDRGTGIPQRLINDIFTAFFSTKGNSGTGLGLWVSKGIIDRHHGTLRVRSNSTPGHSYTLFQVFLPFQAVSGNADEYDSADSTFSGKPREDL